MTHFISCDWGTSNFRLRVVDQTNLRVVFEHTGGRGIRNLNSDYSSQQQHDRFGFFAAYLRQQIGALPTDFQGCPIIASGMISSNIGMIELPYADLPIDQFGAGLNWQDVVPWGAQKLRVVSGVKSQHGIMRGEETQALGLLPLLPQSASGVLVLPGTHSKHLLYERGAFTDFTSYMTGELFETFTKHTILANSVNPGPWTPTTAEYFAKGVRLAQAHGLSSQLFAIRAGHVLEGTNLVNNYYLLSGLLIGDELAQLAARTDRVFMAGSGALAKLYSFACECLSPQLHPTVFSSAQLDGALILGQVKILEHNA